ncbi:MAG TPA: glycosyltransferase family 4 protein, partial [Planctomycetia bacterium]|nr:glycosyltransferase family 4 protein [Planctomycetia bacterium]
NGVDVDAFAPPRSPLEISDREALRREWGWEDLPILLLIAHNFRLKGLDTLLAAAALERRAGRRWGVVVAGAGEIARYVARAKRLGIADSVLFLGDRPDPRPVYRAADVYVQPTYYDPCSLVVLEALACGLPVVTSKFNGAGELLEPGREGFVVADPGDAARLAATLAPLADAAVRGRMGEAARALAERNSFERNCQALVQLYATARRRRAA